MHVNVNMVRGKITGQYVNSHPREARGGAGGYDEAILLDISGFVAEASGENIFMVDKKASCARRRCPRRSSPASRATR